MFKPALPSIFNDVIGPVMRGPSSSHTAASWRIAVTCLQLLNDELHSALIELDRDGVWASNYREQGTAMGMSGGLLGIEIMDERIINPDLIAKVNGISIEYRISSFKTDHTNTVRITLTSKSGKTIIVIAVSTGGGMFEIRQFNGQDINLRGDSYDCLVLADKLIRHNSPKPFDDAMLEPIKAMAGSNELVLITPVLPVVAGNETDCPFHDINSLLKYAEAGNVGLGKLGMIYESCRSGLSEDELDSRMREIIRIIEQGIVNGLKGTEYADRILHWQSGKIREAEKAGRLKSGSLVNLIISNITALMEAKSAMEVIVAVPTAGSCGTFGGTMKAFCDYNKISEDQKLRAYFAGGLIGVYFAGGPGFSAEEHGCQVETGAAACMTAAALVELSGGTAQQALSAASMALQNTIGLICDPVADRVEVPCLGKNVTAGMNALAASSMALAGFEEVIPLDQVINTVKRVGKMLPHALCNTGKGGLAVTPAAVKLKNLLGS